MIHPMNAICISAATIALTASLPTLAYSFSVKSQVPTLENSLLVTTSTQKEAGATSFIQAMVDHGLSFLSNKDLPTSAKAAKFKKLLNGNFDIDSIAKFAVGRYWRSMSSSQQKEYLTLFREMLVGVYSARFDEYQGQEVVLVDSLSLSEKDSLIKSKIINPNGGAAVPVDWRVRHKNGSYKVIDVMVAGVSMSVTQRSDFSSVIQRGGGDVTVLIDHLKN